MTDELKTLKDLGISHSDEEGKNFEHWISIEELKQEAIKWVKDMSDTKNKNFEKYATHYGGSAMYERVDNENLLKWIKMFFNLTDEELK